MERYRQTIYCDLEFLKSIISNLDVVSSRLDDSYIVDKEMSYNIRNLLLSPDVKLYLNITNDEYEKLLSEIYKKRLKAAKKGEVPNLSAFEGLLLDMDLKQQENAIHLHFNAQKIQFDDSLLKDNYLNAIFFSCEPKEACLQAMQNYGIIVACTEMIDDLQYLLFDHGSALRKSEESDWKTCLSAEKVTIPCNSLIVIDNYLLNDSSVMEENLPPLFDAILPKALKETVTFEITIFTTLENDRGTSYNVCGRYDTVMEILHRIRPNISFSLSLLKCSKDKFHDRNIVSGNLFIGCGGGFGLFKNGKSQKTTTVCAFHPFLYMHSSWSRKAYSDLLNEANTIYKKASILENSEKQYLMSNYVYGKKQNRLLDQNCFD